MVVAEKSAADLQRLLVERLGRRVLPLSVEAVRDLVVTSGSVWVQIGEESAVDLQRFLAKRLGVRVLPRGLRLAAKLP